MSRRGTTPPLAPSPAPLPLAPILLGLLGLAASGRARARAFGGPGTTLLAGASIRFCPPGGTPACPYAPPNWSDGGADEPDEEDGRDI